MKELKGERLWSSFRNSCRYLVSVQALPSPKLGPMGGRKWMHFTSTQLEQTNINCVHVPAMMNIWRSINAAFSPSAHRWSGYWVLKARSPQGCYWKVVGLRGGGTCFLKVLVGILLMIPLNDIIRLYLLLFHLSFLHKINVFFPPYTPPLYVSLSQVQRKSIMNFNLSDHGPKQTPSICKLIILAS